MKQFGFTFNFNLNNNKYSHVHENSSNSYYHPKNLILKGPKSLIALGSEISLQGPVYIKTLYENNYSL